MKSRRHAGNPGRHLWHRTAPMAKGNIRPPPATTSSFDVDAVEVITSGAKETLAAGPPIFPFDKPFRLRL
ncbi:hypothetical protein ORS3428_21135 [Mesorhizobium sp. ORS 3428]|nr:hypothetical protein ORS3428_21135 [Mesorhizobium sp. ORS 3428]